MELITGGCICGKVKYTVSEPILTGGLCFCTQCQKVTGGTSWPFTVVKADSLKITGDSYKEYPRLGSSGHKVNMGFCTECGSTVTGRPEAWPDIRTVSASSLDQPELFKPQMQVWTEDKHPWMMLDPEVPIFPTTPR